MTEVEETGTGLRQQVLVLYLQTSALDSAVIGWSQYDGTGETIYMAGDSSEPPYATGLAALQVLAVVSGQPAAAPPQR